MSERLSSFASSGVTRPGAQSQLSNHSAGTEAQSKCDPAGRETLLLGVSWWTSAASKLLLMRGPCYDPRVAVGACKVKASLIRRHYED